MRQPIVEMGEGPPLVVVPGIQGHWEWMRPTLAALSRHFRVVSYSLAGERRSTCGVDATTTFERLVDQLDEIIRARRLERPVVCGVSYGGLVALHHAARWSDRIPGLVLVSTPSPLWRPDRRIMRYRRAPVLFAPIFAAQALRRLMDELSVTFPDRLAMLRFLGAHAATIARTPLSPSRASQRLAISERVDFVSDCRRLRMPVLIVTGERHLDRVVPVESTLEYQSLIPHARVGTIHRTGHLGSITRPDEFARMVAAFFASLPPPRETRTSGSARGPDAS